MTTLNLIQSLARPALNVLVNSQAAYLASQAVGNPHYQDIAIIVAIDTVFRIVITHVLDALKIAYLQNGSAGHLLFPCLTLLTQPLSVRVAQKFFKADQKFSHSALFMPLFGYIALGWKMNMMVKDIVYLCYPSLKKP